MIELYLSKVTETSETEQAGKLYARVNYKQALSVSDMARHMAEHNTVFSEGSILGVLTDFVKCVREQVLNGNTVKIDNLAIFKATVEANGLETLYDAQTDKVAQASLGELKQGDKTGPAVKTVKLLAQSTGDLTRDELKKDVRDKMEKAAESKAENDRRVAAIDKAAPCIRPVAITTLTPAAVIALTASTFFSGTTALPTGRSVPSISVTNNFIIASTPYL